MRRVLARFAPVLHLTRVSTAFAAVGNVWFVILWTRAIEEEPGTAALTLRPLWLLLIGGAASATGLYAFGAALNDLLDTKRDRALRPERPIASGQLPLEAAFSVVAGTLMVAVLGATVFGTTATVLTLALAAAILVFNAAGKFIPAVGLVLLGLIYAGHMLVPNPSLRFIWPVWLVMTHALVVAAVCHRIARKVPTISARAGVAAAAGWGLSTVVLLWAGLGRRDEGDGLWPDWVSPGAAIPPLLLAVLCAAWCWRRVRMTGPGPRAAEKVGRYGALWLTLYGAGWLFGAGHTPEAWILVALAVAGFAGMTVLREWYALMEDPVAYRR